MSSVGIYHTLAKLDTKRNYEEKKKDEGKEGISINDDDIKTF